MNVLFLCLTSVRSAYTDHFLSICYESNKYLEKNNLQICLSKKAFYDSKNFIHLFKKYNFIEVDYNKKKYSSFFNIFIKIIKLSLRQDKIFVYGENPLHSLIFLIVKILKPQILIYTKIADPKSHDCEKIFLKPIYFLSKLILIIISKKIIVASNSLFKDANILLKLFVKNKLENAMFGNLLNLLTLSANENIVPYNRRKYDLVFFGRFEKYKGINIFLDVAKEIYKINPNLKFLMITKSNKKIKSKNIYHINKYIDDKSFIYYIKNSKIGFFPYLNATGSHVVQNMNLFGGFVIANSVGYFNDAISNNKNGYIVKNNVSLNKYKYVSIILKYLNLLAEGKYDPYKISNYSKKKFDQNYFLKIIFDE